MFDYQRLFHTGIRVPNIEEAMAEIGSTLNVTWATPMHNPAQDAWTPEGGQQTFDLKYAYSAEGPQHIELLESEPGSPWFCGDDPGVHHQGVWVDDVAAEAERCIAAGWSMVVSSRSPEERYGNFAYLKPPSGMIVEVVNSAALPRFEAWWAGGSLG